MMKRIFAQIKNSAPRLYRGCGACCTDMEYDISKWLIPVPDPYTLTDAKDWLSSLCFERGVMSAITLDGEAIGMIGIDPNAGYWTLKNIGDRVCVRLRMPCCRPISRSFCRSNLQ